MAAALTLARACPELRTLFGDCGGAADNSTAVYCVTQNSDDDDSDFEDDDDSGSDGADNATCAAESVDVAQVTSLEIEAVDLSSVNSSNAVDSLYVRLPMLPDCR